MSEAQEKTVKLLDSKLDAAVIKTVTTCAIVMIVAVLIHDGDHIRQALNWGVWNYSYFALIKGVTYNGVFYQGVDWLSWVLLFHIPVCCLPCSLVCFRQYLKLKHDAAK